MIAPPASAPRIIQLDALRGIAVIGIVWMNIYVFALPAQGYYNPAFSGELSDWDGYVWLVSFVFAEDKFRTLFAMLFGAGCLILIEKSGAAGRFVWRAHYARMAVLFAIGMAHSVLLASNDVLRSYALAGCFLPLLAQMSHRSLYVIAVGLIAVHLGGGIITFGTALFDYFGGRLNGDAYLFADRNFGSHAGALQLSLERGGEGFLDRVARRSSAIPEQLVAVAVSLPINLAAIALGMALMKDRMFAGEWRLFRLQRLAAVCAILSIPPLLALAWWTMNSGFAGPVVGANALVLSTPFDTALSIAYAALAMAFFTQQGWAARILAAAGRLSLTNYLMTSVICGALFANWGFALFGAVTRTEAIALSALPVAAMLLWSPIWDKTLGQGPFERVWRGAARWLS